MTQTTSKYSIEKAREIYAMGFVPAKDAGHDPYAALDVIRAGVAIEQDERAAANLNNIWVGKVVNDGKLGRVLEIDQYRVKIAGYRGVRWAHIGELTDWSFRDEAN